MSIPLSIDGPHSGEYSREVAETMAAAARVLNHATLGAAPGLDYASDAYSVTGSMASTAARLEQLAHQLSAFLERMHDAGRLGDDEGESVSVRVLTALDAYAEAGHLAALLSRALAKAQTATSHLRTEEG